MSTKLTCPLCFRTSDKSEYKFFCDIDETCFSSKNIGVFSSLSKKNKDTIAYCPECNSPTNTIKCPTCNNFLPSSILSCSPINFSIIGMQSSGKSHFISQIIDRIYSLIPAMNWDLVAADSLTLGKYTSNYRNPLYLRRELISKTNSYTVGGDNKRPLLYSLQLSSPHSNKRVLLSLHDSAGEDLENLEGINLEVDYAHLAHSSGILLLLDPLQFDKIRNSPQMASYVAKFGLPPRHSKASVILKKVIGLLGDNISRVPLAIAFSKMDTVSRLFGEDSSVYYPPENKGHLNLSDIKSLNDDMCAWLSEYQGDDDILSEISKFSKKSVFGFSALGNVLNKQAGKTILASNPKPVRVEDSFLWLMYMNKLIKGR